MGSVKFRILYTNYVCGVPPRGWFCRILIYVTIGPGPIAPTGQERLTICHAATQSN